MGFSNTHLPKITRKLNDDIENTTGKTLFLKALYDETSVTILDGQASSMLNSFAIANGLVIVEQDCEKMKKGSLVTILPIDQFFRLKKKRIENRIKKIDFQFKFRHKVIT